MRCPLVVRSSILSSVLSLAFAGCSSSGSETPTPAASPSPAPANAAMPGPDAPPEENTKVSKEGPADTKAIAPEPGPPSDTAAAVPTSAGPLRIVAERVGPMDLLQWGNEPILALEGEPLALVDGVPTRRTKGGRGLAPRDWLETEGPRFTFGGDPQPPGSAWITSTQPFDHSASVHTVYERVAQGWRALDLRKGRRVAYYSAYVEREGTLFGLKVWTRDPQQDGVEGDDRKGVERAKPAWVHLAGPQVDSPKIPTGIHPLRAVATDDGALHALARVEHEDDRRLVMLVWPKGSTEATQVDLPGALRESSEPTLATSGTWALLWGLAQDDEGEPQSYLAVGRGTTWERVEVKLPDRSDDGPKTLVGAAKTSEGELWIARSDPFESEGHEPSIWRKPVEGSWEAVPYPKTDVVPTRRAKRWIHRSFLQPGGLWAHVEPHAVDLPPAHPTGLLWAAGAVWIVLDVGQAYVDDIPLQRTLLLTTKATDRTVIELPSASEIHLERHNERAKTRRAGDDGCDEPSLLLGSVPEPQEQRALADKLLSMESVGPIRQVYVGTLDGAEVLVAPITVDSSDVAAMKKAAAKTTGRPIQIDCRIPPLVRMIKER